MPIIENGNLVADVDDDAAQEFRDELDTGITWLSNAQSGWDSLSASEKQSWLLNNFDTVLLINLRVLKFIKWLVKRL